MNGFQLNDGQYFELYFYKFHSKILRLNPLQGSHLPWFDQLPIEVKKKLLSGLPERITDFSTMPIDIDLPLESQVDQSYKKKHEQFIESIKKRENYREETRKRLEDKYGNLEEHALRMLKEGKIDELMKEIGKPPPIDR